MSKKIPIGGAIGGAIIALIIILSYINSEEYLNSQIEKTWIATMPYQCDPRPLSSIGELISSYYAQGFPIFDIKFIDDIPGQSCEACSCLLGGGKYLLVSNDDANKLKEGGWMKLEYETWCNKPSTAHAYRELHKNFFEGPGAAWDKCVSGTPVEKIKRELTPEEKKLLLDGEIAFNYLHLKSGERYEATKLLGNGTCVQSGTSNCVWIKVLMLDKMWNTKSERMFRFDVQNKEVIKFYMHDISWGNWNERQLPLGPLTIPGKYNEHEFSLRTDYFIVQLENDVFIVGEPIDVRITNRLENTMIVRPSNMQGLELLTSNGEKYCCPEIDSKSELEPRDTQQKTFYVNETGQYFITAMYVPQKIPITIIDDITQYEKSIKVENTDFEINYNIIGGKILKASLELRRLVFVMDSYNGGSLLVTIPRELIDSKKNDTVIDKDFIVLVDGNEILYQEIKNAESRKLTIPFAKGDKTIEFLDSF